MKYIKTFEAIFDGPTRKHSAKEFKKYIAWLCTDEDLSVDIFRNKYRIEPFGDRALPILKVEHLYTFNFNKNELNKVVIKGGESRTSGILLHDDVLTKRLIYQSDDLQDIIDNLPLMKNSIKFNI